MARFGFRGGGHWACYLRMVTATEAMITAFSSLWVGLFAMCALVISVHLGFWLHLLWLRRRPVPALPAPLVGEDLPLLLLQLPLYNEEAVVDGLLSCIAHLDWPRERLEIQVLDDSTDGTPERVAARLPGLRARGLPITHLRRGHREGFKAGALAHGLEHSEA